jgi:hypothetical protein
MDSVQTHPTEGRKRVTATFRPMEERDARGLPYDAFLRDYLTKNRPLIIRNATADWPALRKWTPQFFKERFGSRMVQVSYEAQMTFSDFIDGVMASTEDRPGPYMYRLFLHQHLPEVLEDLFPQNKYAFARRYASPLMMQYWRRPDGFLKLLIGGIGGRFPIMHYDGENAHATITEIYGDKEFIVYSPEDTPYLYPAAQRGNHSQVDDPHRQDLERFPLLAKATQYRSVLHPGDMVFVPSGWWHTARALEPSISVGMNMLDRSNWKGFVTEICGPLKTSLRPRKLLKRAYFEALGPLLSALENVQRKFPTGAEKLVVPHVLAPDTSAVTPDPASRRLRIREDTF